MERRIAGAIDILRPGKNERVISKKYPHITGNVVGYDNEDRLVVQWNNKKELEAYSAPERLLEVKYVG